MEDGGGGRNRRRLFGDSVEGGAANEVREVDGAVVARGGEDRRRSEVELEPVASMAAAALLRGGEAEADSQGASASVREDEDAIPSRCREGKAGRAAAPRHRPYTGVSVASAGSAMAVAGDRGPTRQWEGRRERKNVFSPL